MSSTGPPATTATGLFPGVPSPVGRIDISDIDPALDECCRRDEEDQRRGRALRTVLRHHDRIAAAERARNLRNLVTLTAGGGEGLASTFQGCRCCYDPNRDGGGDYRALLELRAEQPPPRPSMDNPGDREPLEAAESDPSGSDDSDAELDDMMEGLEGWDNDGSAGAPSHTATTTTTPAPVAWEERRRRELEDALQHRQAALEHGYGAHRPVHPSRVWGIVGLASSESDDNGNKRLSHPPPAAVVHLVDPDSRPSASLDVCLERLATSADARGTVFVRTGGRSALLLVPDRTTRFLPRLRVETDLPALVAIRDGVVVAVCPNLQGLVDDHGSSGGGPTAVANNVVEWLDRAGVLRDVPPPPEALCRLRPEEEALLDHLAVSRWESEENSNSGAAAIGECYDCGLPECRKSYAHTHVGIETTQQSGLVVPSELSSTTPDATSENL